jgi:hypothetical protein
MPELPDVDAYLCALDTRIAAKGMLFWPRWRPRGKCLPDHSLFEFAMTLARRYAKIFPTVRRGENCRARFDRKIVFLD